MVKIKKNKYDFCPFGAYHGHMAHVARENNKRRNWPQKRQQEDAVSVALEGLIWANINSLIIQSHFVSNQ